MKRLLGLSLVGVAFFMVATPVVAQFRQLGSLIGPFVPLLEDDLSGVLEPLLGDYTEIASGVLIDGFQGFATTGQVNFQSLAGSALPDVVGQLAEDHGLSPEQEAAVLSGGYGVLHRDRDRILETGLDFGLDVGADRLEREIDRRNRRRANNSNGTNTGNGTGTTPTFDPRSLDPNIEESQPGLRGPRRNDPVANDPRANDPNIEESVPGRRRRDGVTASDGGRFTPGTGANGIPDSPGIYQKREFSGPGPAGNTACSYTTTCIGSLPAAFTKIFTDARGVLGIVDPVQVRGQTFEQAALGKTSDAFAVNAFNAANQTANDIDRELTRASTREYLSKEGQEALQASQQATSNLVQSKRSLVSNGLQARSSQNVLKAILGNASIIPELQSAQIALQRKNLVDNQYMKLNTANISESSDWQRRIRDTELNAQTYSSLYDSLSVSLPLPPAGTPSLRGN